jgi:hypothetical protein
MSLPLQREKGIAMQRFGLSILTCVVLGLLAQLAIACGGSDKPPLTPDDVTANALDAGDVPPPTGPAAPAN